MNNYCMLHKQAILSIGMMLITQVFLPGILPAQTGGDLFYHLTTANGLSSDRINDILQDKDGFYWIATQDGLNCFDGSSCKIYRSIKNDSTSLSHNNCAYLAEDNNGDIWVGTQGG